LKVKKEVEMPFNCDDLICPKCGESNCLSIIHVDAPPAAPHRPARLDSLKDLFRIRQF
jgi:hypothetical protein